jgi:hypothetical protein
MAVLFITSTLPRAGAAADDRRNVDSVVLRCDALDVLDEEAV